jgi:hypothetical protein
MAEREIKVNIGGDTSGLDGALSRSQENLRRFAKVGAAAFAAAAVALVALTNTSLANIDATTKQARSLGLTTAALQKMSMVAGEAGIDTGKLSGILGIMQRNVVELEKGTKLQTDAFGKLGLSIKDLQGLSPDEQFRRIAESLDGITDPATKTAAAMDIFGRSGRAAINMLSGYSEKVQEAEKFQDRFGITVSQFDAERIEAANDAAGRVSMAFEGLGNTLASKVAPNIIKISNDIIDVLGAFNDWITAKDDLKIASDNLVTGLADQIEQTRLLDGAIGTNTTMTVESARVTLLSAQARHKDALAAIEQRRAIVLASGEYESLSGQIAGSQALLSSIAPNENLVPFSKAEQYEAEAVSLAALLVKRQGLIDSNDELDQQAKNTAENVVALQEALNNATGGVVQLGTPQDPIDPTQTTSVGGGGGGIVDRITALQESLMTETELLTEWYETSGTALDEALEAELLKHGEHKEAKLRLDEEYRRRSAEINSNAAKDELAMKKATVDGVIGLIANMGTRSKALAKVAVALNAAKAMAETAQNTASAQMRALAELGPIAGAPIAAKIGAYGAIQMGIIGANAALSLSGGGRGGSGGGGSIDGSATTAAPAQQQATTFAFTIQNDPMGFGESFARQMIEQLNEAQRNGGQVRGVLA